MLWLGVPRTGLRTTALKDLLETPGLLVVFKYYSVCLFVF